MAVAAAGPAWAASTERVSVGPGGRQAGGAFAAPPAISADGRLVVFNSSAADLVPGDANGRLDVFVRDRVAGRTERVSVATGGAEGDRDSITPAPGISGDGRYVAFRSEAGNLVAGDTNNNVDAFVRDRQSGSTSRISLRGNGRQFSSSSVDDPVRISADGRFLAFALNSEELYLHQRLAGKTRRVVPAPGGGGLDGALGGPALSAEGRFLAFISIAPDLVPGDTNESYDAFVRDRRTGATTRVNVGPGGRQAEGSAGGVRGPVLSYGGRFVAFDDDATNLVSGDTNGRTDVFVHDRQTGRTTRVSVGPGGVEADRLSRDPSISADGRLVAFVSAATNLVAGDTNGENDVFVHDRQTGLTTRVSVGPGGAQADDGSFPPAISADGAHVTFASSATNLVPGDTNGQTDVFVHTR